MKKIANILFFIFISLYAHAQNRELNAVWTAGGDYIFTDAIKAHKLGAYYSIGLNTFLQKGERKLLFNPGINILRTSYNTQLEDGIGVSFSGVFVGINLDVLLKVAAKLYLRVGLNGSYLIDPKIDVVLEDKSSASTFYSNSDLYYNFTPVKNNFKALVGISRPLYYKNGKRSGFKLGLCLIQNATALMSSDYNLNLYKGIGSKTLFSSRSIPTSLVASIEWNFFTKRNKKKEEE